ncbi:MAG: DUF2169 domain-containing protein [Myxococcota bacterium]
MHFENRTPFGAGLLRTSVGNGMMAGSVLVRILYAIDGEVLRPVDELLPCPADGEETIFGVFEPDTPYDKNGVDLVVVGHVYPPDPPAVATTATVRVLTHDGQQWTRDVVVFGDRHWQRSGRQWSASPPVPFDRMEISLTRAFGGSAEREDMRLEYPLNPHGIGFYTSEAQAEGQPLPNFEEPDQRIVTWSDAPEPAGLGFCPYELGMRARDAVAVRDGQPPSFDLVGLLSSAFPRMVAPPIVSGQQIQLEHFTPQGRLAFGVPDPQVRVRMRIGSKTGERPLGVEQIGIAPDLGRVFVTYRYPFRYQLRAGEERSCLLVPAAESLPASA